MNSYKPLLGLLVRYGMVGVAAVVVHTSISLALYKFLSIDPFWSHATGWFGGLFTAYLGHYHFSFKDDDAHKKRFPRFVISSLIGLTLHQGGVYILVNQLQLDYSTQALPLLMVSIPVATFLMSKFWVFK